LRGAGSARCTLVPGDLSRAPWLWTARATARSRGSRRSRSCPPA